MLPEVADVVQHVVPDKELVVGAGVAAYAEVLATVVCRNRINEVGVFRIAAVEGEFCVEGEARQDVEMEVARCDEAVLLVA